MDIRIYYYFINKGKETTMDSASFTDTISHDLSKGKETGVIIKEVEYHTSNILLWAISEDRLKDLIKSEKNYWQQFSDTLKKEKDPHYIQFEKLSNQFNIEGKIFNLNLSVQTSYP
ncbi:hypothetical protein ETI05_10825 [Macrococcoides canis]|uniref:hypothetical protein n=1 Tax=Macrococcoides canis TaxID=1855823 RepID=UPI00105C04F2|nr:hypothetical protein [Macrococcus canis]TDM19665.1 hypothetical protein ETI05_10825 [Macrococcus canis]TDM35489.1 hypothetical protein ETI11_10480 [Macrococcus canis]